MSVTRFDLGSQPYLVVAHADVTRRYVGPREFGTYKGWWLSTGKPIAAEEWGAARAITSGEMSLDEEIEIEAFDGVRKLISHSAVPLFDAEHRIAGAIIVNQEITARKRAESEREALLAERDRLWHVAEDANRMKDDFIATLSHELRTPLQSVLGWATMLKQGVRDEPKVARAVAAIERNARILTQLLVDTLDFSRIARGKLNLDRSQVELRPSSPTSSRACAPPLRKRTSSSPNNSGPGR